MLAEYFKNFEKKILKSTKAAKAEPGKKAAGKTRDAAKIKPAKQSSSSKIDLNALKEQVNSIIPSYLTVDSVRPIDSSGFSPEGADLVAFKGYCRDIMKLMGGYVPCELVYGTFHIVGELDRNTLHEVLNRIISVKKLNMFAQEDEGDEKKHIPSFIIATGMSYTFMELKNDIINYYMSKGIDYSQELDLLAVLGRGIIVKNWREKRNFIAIESKDDTCMWFCILMNEYLDIDEKSSMDLRKYIKNDTVYKEY